jgi:3-oxoacyl-[acyl-carrier-protein] synthase-1
MTPLAISHYTATTAAGQGRDSLLAALRAECTGLRRQTFANSTLDTWIGIVDGLEQALPAQLANWDCRNNRLAYLALTQDGFLDAALDLRSRHDPQRIGVFVGTSTSGVLHTETAYRERDREANRLPDWFQYRYSQSTHSLAEFVGAVLGARGPSVAISTACSSSAKVFAAAARAIAAGVCDVAVVGGVDSMCLTTLHGFNSLQLVSADICRPADARRSGISIGEAGGFAILEPVRAGKAPLLLGYGESSDAFHMSTPDPEGKGALAAMRSALDRAGVAAADIDYINLHGTGTPSNDLSEDRGVCALFGTGTPCSSTKGWTGHTLGAAGIVEAAISLLCIEHGFVPRSLNTREQDPQIHGAIALKSQDKPVRRVLSNSFGFGGSNCSLLFGSAA